jgi:hypothetical protein
LADGIDDAGTVTVRNDPREWHPVSEPVATFLRIARVHAREDEPDADLAGAGLTLSHLANLEHLRRQSGPFLPS